MTNSELLKNRQDLHLARKFWHVTTVTCMFLIYHYASLQISIALLILVGGFGIGLDLVRLRNKNVNEKVLKIMGPLMRDTEAQGFAGTTSLIIGVFCIVSFFPKPIVELSLLFLAFADPVASFVGIRYGKDKIFGRKSLQGTLAGFMMCTFISVVYLAITDTMAERLLVVSLLSGLVGALAEAIPIAKLDDNFVLPILSSMGIWVIFNLFGGFLV